MSDTSKIDRPARRALMRTAVWTAPVVAASTVAPAMAASCTEQVEVVAEISADLTTNPTYGPKEVVTHVIPDGVTTVEFEVLGGGGGLGDYNAVSAGPGAGSGDLITGSLSVAPGATLTLIAGNGGMGPSALGQGRVTGGDGYGYGGHTPAASGGTSLTGGSGGGGSAILLDDAPAVVAGGGGGVAAILARPSTGWTITGGSGGAAEENGSDVSIRRSGFSAAEITEGGGGADGATPGQPRGVNGSNGTVDNGWRRIVGAAGTGPAGMGVTGGGNGGFGVNTRAYSIGAETTLVAGSGGGGGGYAGGASGTAVARVYDYNPRYQYAIGGSGGGGSSHVSDAVQDETIADGGNGATDGVRHPGRVLIRYEIPCRPA